MKRRVSTLIVSAAAFLFAAHTAWSWSNATCCQRLVTLFESHGHPDLPLNKFAAGQMGIIQPTWDHSYLYAAYRYLNGPGFNPSEQQAILALWDEWLELEPVPADAPDWTDATLPSVRHTVIDVTQASSEWVGARSKVPDIGPIEGIVVYRSAQAAMFSFANCNSSSFLTAAATLNTMIAKFGLASVPVRRWVNAQDQVFDNCSDSAPQFNVFNDAWREMVEEWTQQRRNVASVEASPGSFSNSCPGMTFRTAALSLQAIIEKHGASSPEVKQWVETEDKALDACSSRSGRDTGPIPPPDIPAPLIEGTPFERAQRNYQIAAATFYSGDYDGAAKLFEAIAADFSSPWQHLAPYLVARAMIRKATLSAATNDNALLAQAEARLNKIVATSDNQTVKHDAQQVLDFVETKLHPDQREEELAQAVMRSTSGEVLKRDVSDYVWMLEHHPSRDVMKKDDLTFWISDFASNFGDPVEDRPIERWKKTSSLPWLVAAISWIEPSDPQAQVLIQAAQKLKPESPAFVTVTYHIARIRIGQGKTDEARAILDCLLAMRDLPISTVNELKRLRMSVAKDLAELLEFAPRTPLGFTDTGDFNEIPSSLLDTPTPTGTPSPEPTVAAFDTGPSPREAGRWGEGSTVSGGSGGSLGLVPRGFAIPWASPIPATTPAPTPDSETQNLEKLGTEPLFDDDGAAVLTRGLPLSLLVEAAQSTTLPSNLHQQVALTAFVKAMLLNNEVAARDLAPLVIDAYPKLKPLIERWLMAKGSSAKNFAAAFMILQNPGMSFDLESGAGRTTPLEEIDEFHDNWWPAHREPHKEVYAEFLSRAEKKSAIDEWQKLTAINAPNFLCSAAIEHAKSDPNDARAPEALYGCLTAVHLGCSNDHGTELAKAAFQLLHRQYPNSDWADRGHIWYRGDHCGP